MIHRSPASPRPGWDALLVAVLVIARLRIDSLAEQAVLPFRFQDVLRHPILGRLLSPAGWQAMGEVNPSPGEPVALLLIALSLGLLILYLLVDLLDSRFKTRLKWTLLTLILATTVFLPTARMMLLRQGSGPASYAHDGGVIQTESVIDYFVQRAQPLSRGLHRHPHGRMGLWRLSHRPLPLPLPALDLRLQRTFLSSGPGRWASSISVWSTCWSGPSPWPWPIVWWTAPGASWAWSPSSASTPSWPRT